MKIVSIFATIKARLGMALSALASGFFSVCRSYAKNFDIRDYLVYGGLLSIGYGFYMFLPWLGFVVFGVVSMLLGLGWILRVKR